MKKRTNFLIKAPIFFLPQILVALIMIGSEFIPVKNTSMECSNIIPKEVELMAEFGLFECSNEALGVGVVSFRLDNKLYALGHDVQCEENSSVYKILPKFKPCHDNELGCVEIGNTDELEELGEISQSNEDGVILASSDYEDEYSKIEIANTIHFGNAQLLMRDEYGELHDYSVIVWTERNRKETKLIIKVTDEDLLSKTGGIVPGMSGTPIIQDDKLIGVVSHAYVKNQRKGIGKIIWNTSAFKNYN